MKLPNQRVQFPERVINLRSPGESGHQVRRVVSKNFTKQIIHTEFMMLLT